MIREATEEDCIRLAALSLEVWYSTYALDGINTLSASYTLSNFTGQQFANKIGDPSYRLLVKTEGEYLRGYALVNLASTFETSQNGFEIDKLYVHSPFQGQGIGKELLNAVRQQCGEPFWLHTWVHNKAIGFYQRYGFKDIGTWEFKLGDERIENRVLAYSSTWDPVR